MVLSMPPLNFSQQAAFGIIPRNRFADRRKGQNDDAKRAFLSRARRWRRTCTRRSTRSRGRSGARSWGAGSAAAPSGSPASAAPGRPPSPSPSRNTSSPGKTVTRVFSRSVFYLQGPAKPWVQFCVTQFCQVPQVR